jgi:hypothetical protein
MKRLLLAASLAVGVLAVPIGPADAATTPSAPREVKAVAADRAITLRWKAPLRTGTSPIRGYRLQQALGTKGSWRTVTTVAASVRSFRYAGLVNGSTYRVRVAAVSGAGLGTWSTARTVRLPTALAIEAGDRGGVDGLGHGCLIRPDRTVVCWGSNSRQQLGLGAPNDAGWLLHVRSTKRPQRVVLG